MRQLTKGIAALALVAVALVAGACNKGPAEEALKAADQALETARPELERYVPAELASITDAAKEARGQFEKGNYTEALKAAQGLPAKIQAAVDAAKAKKDELTAAWNQMAGSVPALVDTMRTALAGVVASKKLPQGMDKAKLDAAQADLGTITQAWTEATAAFQGGNVPKAVQTAQDVKAKAEALAGLLGPILPPPAPSAGAKTPH